MLRTSRARENTGRVGELLNGLASRNKVAQFLLLATAEVARRCVV
ncbi:hypothetical protein [Thermoplasma sp. Kam2015]|nr:hypothetical protein [Thermoplasma sp. Kam2015]